MLRWWWLWFDDCRDEQLGKVPSTTKPVKLLLKTRVPLVSVCNNNKIPATSINQPSNQQPTRPLEYIFIVNLLNYRKREFTSQSCVVVSWIKECWIKIESKWPFTGENSAALVEVVVVQATVQAVRWIPPHYRRWPRSRKEPQQRAFVICSSIGCNRQSWGC